MKRKLNLAQPSHVHDIKAIEEKCYPHEFLTTVQIEKTLKRMNSDGYIMLDKMDKVLGYVLYDNNDDHIEVLRLGVHEFHRKCGIGKLLLDKVKSKLTSNKNRIIIHVPDHLTDGHIFLSKNGFIASKIDYKHYRKHHTDSYMFIFLRDWLDIDEPLNQEELVAEIG